MLKKVLLTLVLGIFVTCASVVKVEAAEIYVGTSPSTGWDCYVLTESIGRTNYDVTFVTLKMYTGQTAKYLDYQFWYDSQYDVMRFSNDDGYSGIANRYETPIEWEMLQVIRNY